MLGFLRSEAVLDFFDVTESNWRGDEATEMNLFIVRSRLPLTGRALAEHTLPLW